jgi:hypothetical protein
MGKPERKTQLTTLRNVLEDSLQINLGVRREGVEWIYLAEDIDKRHAVVKTVMNILFSRNAGNFSTSCGTSSFSRITVLRLVSRRTVSLCTPLHSYLLRPWPECTLTYSVINISGNSAIRCPHISHNSTARWHTSGQADSRKPEAVKWNHIVDGMNPSDVSYTPILFCPPSALCGLSNKHKALNASKVYYMIVTVDIRAARTASGVEWYAVVL